jgi:PAS domain-containing protein
MQPAANNKAVLGICSEGKIFYCEPNFAKKIGYHTEDLIGRCASTIGLTLKENPAYMAASQTIARMAQTAVPVRFIRADAQQHYGIFELSAFRTDLGELAGVFLHELGQNMQHSLFRNIRLGVLV